LVFLYAHYLETQKRNIFSNLELKMKNYSFTLSGDKDIVVDIVNRKKRDYYTLNKETLKLYTPINDTTDLVIAYPKKAFNAKIERAKDDLALKFIILSIIGAVVSFLFALYSLKPIKESMRLLDSFIKDIIHDLNTPITSILINLKLLDIENEEINNIKQSANTIAMLHTNLDNYLRDKSLESKELDLKPIVEESIEFFKYIYNNLNWQVELESVVTIGDKSAIHRVVNNLISNACKYNVTKGYIKIVLRDNSLLIENDSYGVKDSKKVFDRFYKESERGLGIGLSIVKRLLKKMNYKIYFRTKGSKVRVLLTFR